MKFEKEQMPFIEVLNVTIEQVFPEVTTGARTLRFEPDNIPVEFQMNNCLIATDRLNGRKPGEALEGLLMLYGLSIDSHKPYEIVVRPTSYWQIAGRMSWS